MEIHEYDLYDILGVTESSTPSMIRKQFHKLSLALHPDKVGVKYMDAYEKVLLAYSIIGDPSLRREYDELRGNKRVIPKAFNDLKKSCEDYYNSNDLNLNMYARQHETEISERHKHLVETYRPRTLKEYESQPLPAPKPLSKKSDLQLPVRITRQRKSECTVLIEVPMEPLPVSISSSYGGVLTVQNQSADDRLGEMYYSGDPEVNVQDYTLEVSREDVTEVAHFVATQPSRLEDRMRIMKEKRYSPSGVRA